MTRVPPAYEEIVQQLTVIDNGRNPVIADAIGAIQDLLVERDDAEKRASILSKSVADLRVTDEITDVGEEVRQMINTAFSPAPVSGTTPTAIADPEIAAKVAEAMKLADAATPGRWRLRPDGDAVEVELMCVNGLRAWFVLAHFYEDHAATEMSEGAFRPQDDAALFAASRTLIPDLCTIITRLSARNAELDGDVASTADERDTAQADLTATRIALGKAVALLKTVMVLGDAVSLTPINGRLWEECRAAFLASLPPSPSPARWGRFEVPPDDGVWRDWPGGHPVGFPPLKRDEAIGTGYGPLGLDPYPPTPPRGGYFTSPAPASAGERETLIATLTTLDYPPDTYVEIKIDRRNGTWHVLPTSWAALSPPLPAKGTSVPAGWQLVPRAASPEMVAAGRERLNRARDAGAGTQKTVAVWGAMLAAAPSPKAGEPTPEKPNGGDAPETATGRRVSESAHATIPQSAPSSAGGALRDALVVAQKALAPLASRADRVEAMTTTATAERDGTGIFTPLGDLRRARSALATITAALAAAPSSGPAPAPETPELTDHKWFDPTCRLNGCQSLVFKHQVEALRALINRIEAPFGWADSRNALSERLKDEPTYVAAYLASKNTATFATAPAPIPAPASRSGTMRDALVEAEKQIALWIERMPQIKENPRHLPWLEGRMRFVLATITAALAAPDGMGWQPTQAAHDVLAERRRQAEVEGWTAEHDDEHVNGSLASAAASYALYGAGRLLAATEVWPGSWARKWFKPKDRRTDLVRAGALILAEIERLDRLEPLPASPSTEGGK